MNLKTINKKIWIPVAVVAVVLLGLVASYNGLVTKRQAVQNALSNIDTQYQRRADLIPNLVSTVKGAANFEQKTLEDLVAARAKATSIQLDVSKATPEQILAYQNAQGDVTQALGKLLAITENYPQLQAVQAFRDLQSQLEGTENRITVARKDYNDAVKVYDTKLQHFPTNLTAGLFGFNQAPYFKADAGASTVPAVKFN